MKKLIHFSFSIILLVISDFVYAACEHKRPVQQIDIRQIDGQIVVENKEQAERCEVSNNEADDEIQAARVVWLFHQINCQPGECLVELAGKPNLSEKALKCDLGTPNRQKCRLKANRLKRYCDRHDPSNPDYCQFNYVIIVRGTQIDPSIIIKPRPALAD